MKSDSEKGVEFEIGSCIILSVKDVTNKEPMKIEFC